jgi:hypothetical protein
MSNVISVFSSPPPISYPTKFVRSYSQQIVSSYTTLKLTRIVLSTSERANSIQHSSTQKQDKNPSIT